MKIQNLILTLCLILLLSTVVSAQKLQVGAIGGLNIANISSDMEDTDTKTLTGFGIGGVLDWKLSNNLSICFQPMYIQKGATLELVMEEDEDFDLFSDIEGEFNYSYIEIPILFKYSLTSGNIKPYLMAGPTIGILTSAELQMTMMDIVSFGVDIKDQSESLDYGIVFGAGVSIPIGNPSLFVEGRYSLGLADVFKGTEAVDEDDLELEDAKVTHTGIQIMAGISIPLGE